VLSKKGGKTMKKFFEEPELFMEKFTTEDVLQESQTWTPGENEGEGDQL
jgi:hypothetical protein